MKTRRVILIPIMIFLLIGFSIARVPSQLEKEQQRAIHSKDEISIGTYGDLLKGNTSISNDSLLYESFEDSALGWNAYDYDGDALTWYINNYTSHTGEYSAEVEYNGSVDNNDWLITPQVTLPEGATITLNFWARSDWGDYPEEFNIRLSTSGSDTTNFVNYIDTVRSTPESWTEYTYDLSNYAGETVYIAFQYVSYDLFWLYLDDVLVTSSGGSSVLADFTADVTSGTAPLTVNFTDQSTGASTWEWDFDNDGTLDATAVQNPSYTYDNTGTYTVSLTVTDGAGTIDTETKTDYITVFEDEWTILVYLDGDNNLEEAGIDDMNEMESVDLPDNVNVLVQFDRISGYDNSNGDWTDTRRYEIAYDTDNYTINSPCVDNTLGELNMGDPQTLSDFVEWGITNYPARKYMLVMWNHGAGWRKKEITKNENFNSNTDYFSVVKEVCSDDTDGDILEMREVKSALGTAYINTSSTYLNIMGFDACLMGLLEVSYGIKDYVSDAVVFSQETEPGDGWDYNAWLTNLRDNPTANSETLSSYIVDSYSLFYSDYNTTQSAIDMTAIDNIKNTIDNFVTYFTDEWDVVDAGIESALKFNTAQNYVDLKQFMQYCANNLSDGSYATDVVTALDQAIIHNGATGSLSAATGLNIYLRRHLDIEGEFYYTNPYCDFAAESNWTNFLTNYKNYLRTESIIEFPEGTVDFETNLTLSWKLIDANNDSSTFRRYSSSMAYSGNYVFGIKTWYDQMNDWLITPQIQVGSNASISFWARSTDDYWLEDFNVKISNTGSDPSDFTVTLESIQDLPNQWTQYTYSLSDYASQDVYVAIQSVSNDKNYLFIDDVFLNNEVSALAADFTADVTSGTAPLTVNFTDQSTGATTWEWDFDNDGTLDATVVQNPSFTYDNAGTYTVSLTVTDGAGTIDTETKTDYITVSTAGDAITSTTTGGNWSEAGTWIGGVVPTASDNVIIDGDVVVDQTSECDDLTVNTGNILRSGTGFYQNLTVNGVLSNAGTIQDNGDTDLNINLKGDLQNSGTIENDDIIFNGSADQYISMTPGAVFQNVHFGAKDSTTSVILTSDLELTDCEIDFDWSDETTSLIIPEGSGFRLQLLGANCFATDVIIAGNGNDLYLSQGAYLYQDSYLANVMLTGTVRSGAQSVTFAGDSVVVLDTLQSNTGFYNTLYANSTLINRGIIQDVGDTELYIEATGDLVNYGNWGNDEIELKGLTDQEINLIGDQTFPATVEMYAMVGTGSYQWYYNDTEITGETGDHLILDSLSVSEYGTYYCSTDAGNSRNIIVTGDQTQETTTLTGTITDATNGEPLEGATVTVAGLSDITGSDGIYTITNVPFGALDADFYADVTSGQPPLTVQFTDNSADQAQTVTASATGYSDYVNEHVTINTTETITLDISLSPELTAGSMRLVLNWDDDPRDLDSHLKTPDIDGSSYHVYYSSQGSATSAPYAILDHDDTDGYGPETVTIHTFYEGVYYYYIYKYAGTSEITASNAVVQVYDEQGVINTIHVPTTGTGRYWNVCTIDGNTQQVNIVNQIQDSAPGPALKVNFPEKAISKSIPKSITGWEWDFGDGNTSTDQNPSHEYTVSDTYTVSLTVTNDQGDTDTQTRIDYIKVSTDIEELMADFTADVTAGTAPLTVQFTDRSVGTPTSWEWDFDNDNNIDATEQNPSYTYQEEGTYTVKLNISDGTNTDAETKTDFITVEGPYVPGEWNLETVDAVGDVGIHTSIALDQNNYAHISYYDNTNDDLKYAAWNGSAWNIETIDSEGNVGHYTSIVIDHNDRPHISYYDFTNDDLKYATWDGSAWNIETVDSEGDVGKYTSLALDDNNRPHFSYLDDTNNDLKYATWDGSAWNIETVDSEGLVGWYTSLAIDQSGYPHISYCDVSNDDLKYATWDGSAWNIETVDSEGDIGSNTSLALDKNDYPHTSYYDYTNHSLKYAKWNGSDWYLGVVDSSSDEVGRYSSIAIDQNNMIHISYYDQSNVDLKYARGNSSEWTIETIDSDGEVGSSNSITVDQNGYPHISYNDYTNYDLKYAFCSPEIEPFTADFIADVTSGAPPLTVNFTDQSTGAISWNWDFGDSNTSTDQNPSHTYESVGSYTVMLTVSDGTNEATETKSDFINVIEALDEPSGWFLQNPYPTPDGLNSIRALDDNTAIAVGISGTIIKTTDAGATWNVLESGTSVQLNDIFFPTMTTGYAVGDNPAYGEPAVVLKTTDGGETWTELSVSINYDLRQIFFIDENTGWIVGDGSYGQDGTVIKTTDGGATWVEQSSGIEDELRSVFFVDANTGWVGGERYCAYTTDGGATWTPVDVTVEDYQIIKEIQFFNASDGWLVATHALYQTSDGGSSWSEVVPASNTYFSALYFADANNGWVSSEEKVYKTTDGGATWTEQIDLPGYGDYYIYGLDFHNSTGWLAGSKGIIYQNTDGNWTEISSRIVSKTIEDVYFINETTGWIVGWMENIWKTTDGGYSWTEQTTAAHYALYAIDFVDANTGWATGDGPYNGDAKIYHTSDGGATWTEQTSGTGNLFAGLDFVDANNGWAVGYAGTILHTTDGGSNWSTQTSNTGEYLNDVFFVDSQTGWICGTNGIILHTTDGGATWTEQTNSDDNNLYSIYFVDADHGFAVGSEATILETNDGGSSWSVITSGSWGDPSYRSVVFADALNGWIMGNEGSIMVTSDGGSAWEPQISPTSVDLKAAHFVTADMGWAVGKNGAIVKTATGGEIIVAIDEPEFEDSPRVVESYQLHQNYPNPFNPTTTIVYDIPDAGKVQLTIFDIRGRLVDELVSDYHMAGRYKVIWDAGKQPSGVYFVRLVTRNFTDVKKMMLLK